MGECFEGECKNRTEKVGLLKRIEETEEIVDPLDLSALKGYPTKMLSTV